MATKKISAKRMTEFIENSTVILSQPEMNWLKEKLEHSDPNGYKTFERVNQRRIDNHNLSMAVEALKARGIL